MVGKILIGFPPCSKLSSFRRMMPAEDAWRIGGRAIHRSECVEYAFSEVRSFLGALTCFVPQRTYLPLTQEYAAFVTWPVEWCRVRA